MDKEKYLENPCGTYALPFWKEKKLKLPENMRVIHEKEFENSYLNIYNDTTYFRLIHYLKDIDTIKLRDIYEVKTVDINTEAEDIVYIINNSYADIQVSKNQVKSWTKEQVYDENLWIFILEKKSRVKI